MVEYKAPTYWNNPRGEKGKVIFLAGSIEMGKAEKWHDVVAKSFENDNVILLNPRRDDWDDSWVQDISNEKFKEQVEWELEGLDRCDLILMYFDPSTKSPISLLELGLYVGIGKIVVVCPEGYWRRGNVQIVCERYGISFLNTLEDGMEKIRYYIKQLN